MELDKKVTQEEFGTLVGISQQAVSNYLSRGILAQDATCQDWLHAYCKHLREIASGHGSGGSKALSQERAELTYELKLRARRENAEAEKLIAPVSLLEAILGKVGGRAVRILESVPADVKRNCASVSAEALGVVQEKIASACNLIAAMSLSSLDEPDANE
ncbi:MAG: hypothetical protein FWC38_00785 [Proteobacteria bacterium]|nr:hypothetical protein [Pseudomonadota bacterium]MCL2306778.1 hypothetical protein [Pseudomonadota bacterium]